MLAWSKKLVKANNSGKGLWCRNLGFLSKRCRDERRFFTLFVVVAVSSKLKEGEIVCFVMFGSS